MRFINKLTQVIPGAHVGVERCPVLGVVAVVGIMREITFGAAAYPAVDLLKRGAYPERIHPQLLQVIELAGQSLEIPAVERTNLLHAVFVAAVTVVVARVTIHIAVSQYKIDGGVLPAKRRRLVGFGALKQQQAVTVGGWLQGDFSTLYGHRLFTVEIAHDGAFREGMADVQRQRLTVPLRTLADNVGHRLFCRALNRQQQGGRAGAGIDSHLVFTVAEKTPLRRCAVTGLERQHLIEFYRACGLPARLVKTERKRTRTLRKLCLAGENSGAFGAKCVKPRR